MPNLPARRAAALLMIGAGAVTAAASTVHPLRATAATTASCSSLWSDTSSDASAGPSGTQADQLDIVSGGLSDNGSTLTTSLTITNLTTTPAAGGTADEYYFIIGAGGKQYFTNAEVAPSGTTYSYGTYDPNATPQYSTTGSATGTVNPGAKGTVTVSVPLSQVGNPASGSTLSAGSIKGVTFLLEGAPSNPGVSGGLLSPADSDTATSGYTIGQGCASGGGGGVGGGSTPTPTPAPPTCTSALCFSNPVVLPASNDTGGTANTCFNPCGEPSLAVSPVDGTMYVSTPRTIVVCCNSQSSPVWKSTDNGQSWSKPIFPSAPESATTGGDTEMAIDKRGTLYEGELWLGSDSIYISGDQGNTWNWSPASHDVGADREWFVYSPNEDALYGWYDGLKGLMVAKAPLSTPAGTSAAMFFPQERIAVPENAAGDVNAGGQDVPPDSVAGVPVIGNTESPGRPSVAPDGTVFFPFSYQVSDQGIGLAYTTDGLNFNYSYVKGAGHGVLGDTGYDWPVTAVDPAGILYVAWVEDKGDGFNVYYASSADKGANWTAPVEVSKGISATAVFPNIVAGSAGQIAISWYGTGTKGDMNNVPNASWNVYATEIANASSAQPTLTNGVVQYGFHTGDICTMGTACTGNTRELLDFFDMKLAADGNLVVVYVRDKGSGTEIAVSRQTSGCLIGSNCGAPGTDLAEFPLAPGIGFGAAGILAAGTFAVRRRRRRGAPPAAI